MRSVQIRRSSPGLGTEMVVLDGLCPELRSLLPHARLNPLLIESAPDPIDVVGEALAAGAVETLHVVAHGRGGGFQLGGQWIDRQALVDHAAGLARWSVQRIALWSCSLGQDHGFIALLAELTGAEVWSSDQPLGEGKIWRLTLSASANAGSPNASGADAPKPPFAAAALATWPHQLNCRANFAGLLISEPFRIQGTKVEQNAITLASESRQPSPDPGTVRFVETSRQGNNLMGSVFYTENGTEVEVKGEISRQYKKEGGSNRDVEAYYLVADGNGSEAVSYLLVTYADAGSTDNLSLFRPGETYKTSSDFKAGDCEDYARALGSAPIKDPIRDPTEDPIKDPTEDSIKDPTEDSIKGDHGSGNHKCPEPFFTELAGVLISAPLETKGTKVQQNEITLASTQPVPESGTMFFRQSGSAGNNLIGSIYYVEDGREVQVEGELSRQVKSVDGSPQSVEGYYFKAKSLDVAYLLVAFTGDGGKENLSFFSPGGTYKTSSDFKCESFFSPAVIAQIGDPGDPEPERFELPPDSYEPPTEEGGTPGDGDTIEQLITVVDPEGDVVPDDAYTIKEGPNDNTITVDLNDADPDRRGDQPFDDGIYTVLFRDEQLGRIVIQSDTLKDVFGGACVEALVAARSRRSSQKSGRKGELITGSRSNRLQSLPGSGEVDVVTGTSGLDVYRLGDQSGAFRAEHGNRDYARIADFGADDRVVLHGGPADYSQSGPLILGGHAGYALSFRGDLIALIQGARAGGAFDPSGLSAAQISYI